MTRCATLMMLVVLGAATVAAQPNDELIERTLAIVGGTPITLSDVRTAVALRLVSSESINDATERLVERALILREVERYAPPEPSRAEIEKRLAEIRESLEPAQYDAALAIGGFTEGRVRGWVRDDLRISAYLDQRFAADGPERRAELIADWILDLRRRTPVVELWKRPPAMTSDSRASPR
jgi:hypothetical protein